MFHDWDRNLISQSTNQSIRAIKEIEIQSSKQAIILIIISGFFFFPVHCEYIELSDSINVNTYMYPVEVKSTSHSNNHVLWNLDLQIGVLLFLFWGDPNTCSQHVKTSCYFDGHGGVDFIMK